MSVRGGSAISALGKGVTNSDVLSKTVKRVSSWGLKIISIQEKIGRK